MASDNAEKLQRKLIRGKIVRAVVLICAVALFLLLLPGVVALVWIPSCATCHNDAAFTKGTQNSPHTSAVSKCTTCHGGDSGKNALFYRERVVYQMAIPIFRASPSQMVGVRDTTCLNCHREVMENTTVSNGIRIAHETCAKGASCLDCHSTVAHGVATIWPRQYDMIACLDCHSQEGVSSEDSCDMCHVGSHTSPAPTAGTAFKSTHGENWRETHGMGDQKSCAACHDSSYCAPCHGDGVPHDERFLSTHGLYAREKDNKCSSCHRDEAFCDDCHGMTMPHPDDFLKKHSGIANKNGNAVCYGCHVESDCDACHAAHIHPGGTR